ncbi:MAG: hypothetical protein R3F59_33605 [Myxococcota bacterium]
MTDATAPLRASRVQAVAAGIALALALGALWSGVTGQPLLAAWIPGWATTKVNTALCIGLGALALTPGIPPRIAGTAAGFAAALAGLTAVEWATTLDLRIDQLLVADRLTPPHEPPGECAGQRRRARVGRRGRAHRGRPAALAGARAGGLRHRVPRRRPACWSTPRR